MRLNIKCKRISKHFNDSLSQFKSLVKTQQTPVKGHFKCIPNLTQLLPKEPFLAQETRNGQPRGLVY